MAIVDRHIDPVGLSPEVLNYADKWVWSAAVSSSGVVYQASSAFSAASVNSTVGPGTAIDVARNLHYQLSVVGGSASSAIISGGTIVVSGSNILGDSVSESVAISAAVSGSVGVAGTAIFGSVGTISFRSVSLATASSSNSSCVTFAVGRGNIIGLPQAVRSTNAVPYAWIGTTPQRGTDGSASYTVQGQSSGINYAGVSFSNALATNTPAAVIWRATR